MPTPAFRSLRQAAGRFRRSGRDVGTLDGLLARTDPSDAFGERLQWLSDLTRWVVRPGPVDGATTGVIAPRAARLRYLLGVLERNPPWKLAVARSLRATVREIDALEVFASRVRTSGGRALPHDAVRRAGCPIRGGPREVKA